MSLGKTVVSLTSIAERIDRLECYGALVLAPKRVCQDVWRQEAAKWEHTKDLKFSLISKDAGNDAAVRAAMMPSDIFLINYDNLKWLANLWTKHYLMRGKYLPINMVVYDEVTRLKNATSIRHTALQRLMPFIPYRIGLTGTLASNGYKDLFGQYLAIDSGARLGQNKSDYETRFFHPESPAPFAPDVLREGSKGAVEELIADITLQMSTEEYVTLPPVIPNTIELHLPPKLQKKYDKMEKEMFVQLDSGAIVESVSKASLGGRCLQFAQGAMYVEPGAPEWESIHDLKLQALSSVVEEANGNPVLIAIAYRHDAERILKKYPDMRWIDSKMSAAKFDETMNMWCEGRLSGIIANPRSMGHGIDRLKEGPVQDLVWFGHTWSLEEDLQTIARLQRQGRTRPIFMHRLVMQNTYEVAQRIAVDAKAETEDELRLAVRAYREQKGV